MWQIYTSLPFEEAPLGHMFQQKMDIFKELPNVIIIADDIVIVRYNEDECITIMQA